MRVERWAFLFLLARAVEVELGRGECVDRPHFYYKCSQLSKYCKYPQATRIRKSCPVTCGVCGEEEAPRRTITFDSSQNGVIKPVSPVLLEQRKREEAGGNPPRNHPAGSLESLSPVIVKPGGVQTASTFRPRNPAPVISNRQNLLSERGNSGDWAGKESRTFDIQQPLPAAPPRIVEPLPHFPTPQAKERGSLERPNRHTVADPEALFRLEGCCKHKGISSQCLSLCTYQTTKKEILAKAVSGSCTMSDARVWVQCAAGGQRNQECCSRNGVTGCDELCNGEFPQNFNQLLTCVNQFLDPILRCHKANLKP